MNNLKRVLSLALSGIMLVGMMAMGASAADFSDAEKIEHTDAVNILVALSVINGKDDGSFDPQGNVTRAEMAKMIAVAMNGGRDTNTGVKGTPTFTDIKGHWAESYIEYCYDMGIISGRGDGTFDPGANVTGLEATKMVLTALGYDSEAYKLTGASWAVRTDELAKQADPRLYEELEDVVMANNASRDTAAQLIWNGLQNWTKRVTPQQNTSTGEVTFVYGNGTGTLLKERYNADIWVGTFVGNDKTGAAQAEKGEITVYGKLTSDVATATYTPTLRNAHFVSDYDISYIGEEVKVIFKDGANGTKNQPDKRDTIFGVFNTEAVTVYNTTKGEIQDGDDADGKVKFGGTSYDVAATATAPFEIHTNYATVNSTLTTPAAAAAAVEALRNGKNGDTVKLVTNTDGKICKAYVVESKIAVVLSKNAEKVTLNNNVGSIKLADNDVYADIAKDDVVVVTTLYNTDATDDDAYSIVKKAEVVSGEVGGFKVDSGKKVNVTLDGTTYKIAGEPTGNLFQSGLGTKSLPGFSGVIGEDVDLYLVNGYVAAAVQTSESASNWSVVLEAKSGSSTTSVFTGLQLQVMDAEGTKSIINVSNDTTWGKSTTSGDGDEVAGISNTDFPRGTLITYTVNKDNEAVIKDVVPYGTWNASATPSAKWDAPTTKEAYNKDTKTFGTMTTTTDCVLFVNTAAGKAIATSGDEITMKAYKIRDLGAVGDGSTNLTIKATKDGKVVAAVMDLKGNPTGATTSRVYGIVSAENGTVKVDNAEKASYTVDVNDVKHTVYLTSGTLAKGDIVSFEPANDNIYADVETSTTVDGSNKIHKVAGNDDSGKTVLGWAKEYNETDSTLTVYTSLTAKDSTGATTTTPSAVASYDGNASTTYAVDKDTKFYYVDQDNDKGVEVGSIVEFDAIKGLKNIIVVHDNGSTKFAKAVIVETSGEKDIIANAATTKVPTVALAGGTKALTVAGTNASALKDTTAAGYAATDNDCTASTFAAGTATDLKFTITAASGSEVTATLDGTAYTSGTDITLAAAGTYTYQLKVTVKEIGAADKTFTYDVKVVVS